jgi:hypothetical protein
MFGTKLRRLPLSLSPIIRQQTNIATDLKSENQDRHATKTTTNGENGSRCAPPTEKTIRDKHLANITVTSFYSQTAIEQLAVKVLKFVS